jgi:hypothetical protein
MITVYIAIGAVGLFMVVLYLAYKHGEKAEKLSKLDATIKAAEDAKKVENEIRQLPADTVSDRLRSWRR